MPSMRGFGRSSGVTYAYPKMTVPAPPAASSSQTAASSGVRCPSSVASPS